MDRQGEQQPSRRRLLGIALAGGAGTAAMMALRPGRALGADGDPIEIGATNVGTAMTALHVAVNERTLSVRNLSAGDNAVAIAGFVATGPGVVSKSAAIYGKNGQHQSYGLFGETTGDDATAVFGSASGADSVGIDGHASGDRSTGIRASAVGTRSTGLVAIADLAVFGRGGPVAGEPAPGWTGGGPPTNTGVLGMTASGTGDGVVGRASTGRGVVGEAEGGIGVNGTATGAAGTGVAGRALAGAGIHGTATVAGGTGVKGVSSVATGMHAQTTTGLGLFAESLGTGLAIRAKGRVRFSSSGAAAIPKGARIRTITNVDAPANCKILVTLNQDPGPGNGVLMARRLSPTSIRVKLAKPATRRVRFSYFILV